MKNRDSTPPWYISTKATSTQIKSKSMQQFERSQKNNKKEAHFPSQLVYQVGILINELFKWLPHGINNY